MVLESVRTALGPERAADYERVTDPAYVQTSRVVSRLSLPAAATDALVHLQKQAVKTGQTLATDITLTAEQRAAQAKSLVEATTRQLRETLGSESNFQVYREYSGQWLHSLTPQPRGAGAEAMLTSGSR